MSTKAKGSVYEVITGTGEDGRRLAPISMSKSDAESLWSDFSGGMAVKVSFTCDNGENIEALPGGGKKTGFKYTYGTGDRAVVIQCSNNGNTCTVSGLSCSTYGGDHASNNDVEQTYCPLIKPSYGDPCDPSLIDDCNYPEPCYCDNGEKKWSAFNAKCVEDPGDGRYKFNEIVTASCSCGDGELVSF